MQNVLEAKTPETPASTRKPCVGPSFERSKL